MRIGRFAFPAEGRYKNSGPAFIETQPGDVHLAQEFVCDRILFPARSSPTMS
jgi:hypothetical protein